MGGVAPSPRRFCLLGLAPPVSEAEYPLTYAAQIAMACGSKVQMSL